MEGDCRRFWSLALSVIFLQDATGLSLRNEHVGKCVHVHESEAHSKLALEECDTGSDLQEWHWNSKTRSLRNPQTNKCLTAVNIQEHDSVGLQACTPEEDGQAWVCSKKGHIILDSKGLHLHAHPNSSKIFLSMERGKSSKWRTVSKKTVCEEQTDVVPPRTQSEPENTGPRIITNIRLWHSPVNHGVGGPKPTQPALNSSMTSAKPSQSLLNIEYGMAWKVTMLVLSCLALLLGVVILILNIYQNRRKKTVAFLRSSNEQTSQPGSPVPSVRAPLTRHAMRLPISPSIQRGEILVEWKDGTVTPLFDTYLTS